MNRRLAAGAAATAFAVLAAAAGIADAAAPGATAWSVGTDLAVGIAFAFAAWLMPAPWPCRLLVGLVGVAWLLGSIVPELRLAHQAVLAIALLAFPTGRPAPLPVTQTQDAVRWAIVVLAATLAFGLLPRPLPAAVFAAITVVSAADARGRWGSRWPLVTGSALVAVVLGGLWLWEALAPGAVSTTLALRMYEFTLVIVALACWVAVRTQASERDRAADIVLRDEGRAGLDGLAAVLADALGEAVAITRAGEPPPLRNRRTLEVYDDEGLVAAVHANTAAILESRVAASVSRAVRLTLDHERFAGDLDRQLDDLEEARERLLRSVDRQRALTATRLRADVVAPLEVARANIAEARRAVHGEAGEALDIARVEIERASDEVLALVAGPSPAHLEDGLAAALRRLAADSAAPIALSIAPGADDALDVESARTLYYVANEAVTNALKHAHASRITISLRRAEDIVVVVADDGAGGADASGSGIRGMAGRLSARGGRLDLRSPPGGGTVVTARLPVSRSASTA